MTLRLTERGAVTRSEIGERGKSRVIKDLALAKKFLGTETFMKVATITLKNVDDYLTLPQRNEVLDTKRTAHKQNSSSASCDADGLPQHARPGAPARAPSGRQSSSRTGAAAGSRAWALSPGGR